MTSRADPRLTDVARSLLRRRSDAGPLIVGVTGGVASGKTTFSAALQSRLARARRGFKIERVCTDGFLHSNAVLASRGLSMRKGFPESYDSAALAAALAAARVGEVDFPGYSHETYDVDPALTRRIAPPGVLIVEGLGLPAGGAARPPLIDVLIYLDAEEAFIEAWFVARFMGLWTAGKTDPASFYARFRDLGAAEADRFARSVWKAINLPVLRESVLPLRALADLVVVKGEGHDILAVTER
jgi:type I pantothenate kinase